MDNRFLEAVRERLQYETGIAYVISSVPTDFGQPDRTRAEFVFEMIIDSLKDSLPRQKFYELLSRYGLTEDTAKTKDGLAQLLPALSQENGMPPQKGQLLSRMLGQLEGKGQYNAERIMPILQKDYPIDPAKKIRAYLGVTGFDLFDTSSFSVGGEVSDGYGVISYGHHMASSNGAPPNRQRLIERCVKSAIRGSFSILRIPDDCPTPTCPRSAGMGGLDQVETKLCGWCLDQLAAASAVATPENLQAKQAIRMGYELLDRGQTQEAIAAYQQAFALNPASVEAQVLLARIYKADSKIEEAMALYRQIFEKHPGNKGAVIAFLLFCSDYTWWPYGNDDKVAVKEGIRVGVQFYKTQPPSPEFLEMFGWFCYKAEDFERAYVLLRESTAYDKTAPRLYILSTVANRVNERGVASFAYQEAQMLERGRQETLREKGLRELAESSLRGAPPS